MPQDLSSHPMLAHPMCPIVKCQKTKFASAHVASKSVEAIATFPPTWHVAFGEHPIEPPTNQIYECNPQSQGTQFPSSNYLRYDTQLGAN